MRPDHRTSQEAHIDRRSRTEIHEVEFGFADWVRERAPVHLSTNAGTTVIAFQEWRKFKEAFAPELVDSAIREASVDLGRSIKICSDPFGGSGTTALACQFLGVHPITAEVNPYLCDLIEAKLTYYPEGELEKSFESILERVQCRTPTADPFPSAPPTFVEPGVNGRFLFWRDVATELAAHRDAILKLENAEMRRFFLVMLGSCAVPLSNATVSGKGRRYRSNWKTREHEPKQVAALFTDACLKAMYEIGRHRRRTVESYDLYRGDVRSLVKSFGHHDVSIFSPPYPNSFDYTDVYNIELWTMGYLCGATHNQELRGATLRSHVQITRPLETKVGSSLTLATTYDELSNARGALWNKQIPEMICAYFADIRVVLSGLIAQLPRRGRIYMVVGDSRYAGVDVAVATILCEEANHLGLDVVRREPFRSMRVSPQQGGHFALPETLLVLRKS